MLAKWLAGALTVIVFAASCSGDADSTAPENEVAVADADTSSSTSTSTSSSTTTSTTATSTTTSSTSTTTEPPPAEPSDEEQILAVIEAYWQTVAVAFADPPSTDPALWADVATIENTLSRIQRVQSRIDAGETVEQTFPGEPIVLIAASPTISGDAADVLVCIRDDAFLVSMETGETLAEAALISRNRISLERVGGSWLVENSEQLEVFGIEEGEECAASLS